MVKFLFDSFNSSSIHSSSSMHCWHYTISYLHSPSLSEHRLLLKALTDCDETTANDNTIDPVNCLYSKSLHLFISCAHATHWSHFWWFYIMPCRYSTSFSYLWMSWASSQCVVPILHRTLITIISSQVTRGRTCSPTNPSFNRSTTTSILHRTRGLFLVRNVRRRDSWVTCNSAQIR